MTVTPTTSTMTQMTMTMTMMMMMMMMTAKRIATSIKAFAVNHDASPLGWSQIWFAAFLGRWKSLQNQYF